MFSTVKYAPELFSSLDDEEVLEDLGHDADLCIFN